MLENPIRIGAALLLAGAVPVAAAGFEEVITFDDQPLGATSFTAGASFGNHISGGTVVAATPANPARSGGQVYGGTSLGFVVEDEVDFSWPAVGGYVTGTGLIHLQAYDFDPDTGMEIALPLVSVPGGGPNVFLAIGSEQNPYFITRALFFSDGYFTLDDLTLGLENIGPGIPEPATWAMMIAGFGVVGGAMRYRFRRMSVSHA